MNLGNFLKLKIYRKKIPEIKAVMPEEWWKLQLEGSNEKLIPLFAWSSHSKETTSKPTLLEVTQTSKELKNLKLSDEISLEKGKITDDVLQKYWSYFGAK